MKVRKRVTVAISGLTFAGAAALTVGWTAVAGDQALSSVAQQDLDPEVLRRIAALPPAEAEEALREAERAQARREAEEAARLAARDLGGAGGAGGAGGTASADGTRATGGAGGSGGAG